MRRHDRGLTLLEVTVASAILGAMVLMLFLILHSTSASVELQSANLKLDERGREALEEIARELRMSGTDALWNASPSLKKLTSNDQTSDLQFYIPGAFDMGAYVKNDGKTVLDKSIRYVWVCDERDSLGNPLVDGKDNDNDGLVDEGYVRKTDLYGKVSRLVDDVPFEVSETDDPAKKTAKRPGFLIARDKNVLTVTLSLETLDPVGGKVPVDPAVPTGPQKRRTILRRVQTTVELRN